MPVLDGWETTPAMQRWEIEILRRPTPIASLTASPTAEELGRISRFGLFQLPAKADDEANSAPGS